jgi:hypothetical protein
MSGSRFGVGLAAGVFFALAVILVSGAITSASSPLAQIASRGSASSASMTTSTLTTMTGTVPESVFNTVPGNQSASGSQSGLSSLSTGSTSAANGQGSPVAGFSSELATMGQLSTSGRALLLAPLVAAVLIGALFYRASLARREQEE